MHTPTKNTLLSASLAVFLLGPGRSLATTFMQFDSTYLGGGWFQYNMQVVNDPFFRTADVTELILNFTNQIDQSMNTFNWTNTGSDGSNSYWAFSRDIPPRPYQELFLVRSSETSYRQGTNGNGDGGVALLSLDFTDFCPLSPVDTGNVVGYANFPCLVPCGPDKADGSPTNFSYTVRLLPDIVIQQLIQSNGMTVGVDFVWNYYSTFVLQASPDLQTWTNVAYIDSTPPETLWTTNQSLNSFGNFFRVELLANGYATNLPPLNPGVSLPQSSAAKASLAPAAVIPHVSGARITAGHIAVNLVTEPGQNYAVEALDSRRIVQATRTVLAKGVSATVYFDARGLPSPVFFQVETISAP